MAARSKFITSDLLIALTKYWRLANYLSVAQLYLQDNFLLEEDLQIANIKPRILGHWGTVPGLNFIYACLNIIIQQHQRETMFVMGPGHGYPALLSNLYIEGTLGKYYPQYAQGREGMGKLIRNFSWPGGFPSHANPETPGVLVEGGELGYALATAYGAAFDNPNLIVACVIGDGEAETGPTAAAWHSNKYLNPITSGAVLPILHLNKFKISGPTLLASFNNEELFTLFRGYGYDPIIVEGDFLFEPMLSALDEAYTKIVDIQNKARSSGKINKPAWPMIILKSKKGWTGPKKLNGLQIEDTFHSHGIPLEDVHHNKSEFLALESWLKSYQVQELLDENGKPSKEITSILPSSKLRMGLNKHANGGEVMQALKLPDTFAYEVLTTRKNPKIISNIIALSHYLRDLIKKNPRNFRLMSPDESESNKLQEIFKATERGYVWPTPEGSEAIGPDGRVMEILSEHTLQGWLEGYLLTGRHGLMISYEAFMMITASMLDQFCKFLLQMQKVSWRKPIPSLNIILTSTSWRQDHNGFSHQNPGFISTVLNNHFSQVNVHFPSDANMLIATMNEAFASVGKVNIIVADKRPLPQYLSLSEANRQLKSGIARWNWAGHNDKDPDVILVATGDHMTQESLAAIALLKEQLPELSTRFINISEITCFGIGDNRHQSRVSARNFQELFPEARKIIYAYHGYPEDIKQLIFGHPEADRFDIHGYIERGTTTTPFDMLVQNNCSRYNLALAALDAAVKINPSLKAKAKKASDYFESLLLKHHLYIKEYGEDIPEVKNFVFNFIK